MLSDKMTVKLQNFERLWLSHNEAELLDALSMSTPPDELALLLNNKEKSPVKIIKYNEKSDSKFAFVIPTASVKNETSTNLRKQLNDLPIIFVEAMGRNFNYAHSCNAGISEALNSSYDWIIVCNDDIILQESPHALGKYTNKKNGESVLTPDNRLSTSPKYHGESFSVFKTNPSIIALTIYNTRWGFSGKRVPLDFIKKFVIRWPYLFKYFKYSIGVNNNEQVFARFSKSVTKQLINFSDFGIFPSDVLSKFKFDETFWNGSEDYDLVVRLDRANIPVKKVTLSVHSIGSASFGHSVRKNVVSLLDGIYFSHKFSNIYSRPETNK